MELPPQELVRIRYAAHFGTSPASATPQEVNAMSDSMVRNLLKTPPSSRLTADARRLLYLMLHA